MEAELPLHKQESAAVFLQATMRSGPLPDPETLRSYNELMPTAVDRIFGLAERDQSFQHTYRLRGQSNRHTATIAGQIAGTLIALAGIAGAVILALHDKPFMGAVSFIGSVGSIIAAALYSRAYPPTQNGSSQPVQKSENS